MIFLCPVLLKNEKKIRKLFSKIKANSQLTYVKPFYSAAEADLKTFKIPFPYFLKLGFFRRQEYHI